MIKTWQAGCYGDGTFGHQHTRERCAEQIKSKASRLGMADEELENAQDIAERLTGEMSDDACEEEEACQWLNENAPLTGHFWGWYEGDFGLWPEED